MLEKRQINTLLHNFEAIRQMKHYLKSGGLQYISGDKLSKMKQDVLFCLAPTFEHTHTKLAGTPGPLALSCNSVKSCKSFVCFDQCTIGGIDVSHTYWFICQQLMIDGHLVSLNITEKRQL